jgi:hypothetical protein
MKLKIIIRSYLVAWAALALLCAAPSSFAVAPDAAAILGERFALPTTPT